jgi:hypothetical protein
LTLAGVVPAIIKLSESSPFNRAGGAVLILSGLAALVGASVVWKGHSYYQSARQQLQAIERQLGLPQQGLTLATTEGMKRGHAANTHASAATPGRWRRLFLWLLRLRKVTNSTIALLVLLAGYDFVLGTLSCTGSFPGKPQQASAPESASAGESSPETQPNTKAGFVAVDGGMPENQTISPDAGPSLDAGIPPDTGPSLDAGIVDAGTPDAGILDAGTPDAGP